MSTAGVLSGGGIERHFGASGTNRRLVKRRYQAGIVSGVDELGAQTLAHVPGRRVGEPDSIIQREFSAHLKRVLSEPFKQFVLRLIRQARIGLLV